MVGRVVGGPQANAQLDLRKFMQLSVSQKFKVVGGFIHGDPDRAKIVLAKAEAKRAAKEIVATASRRVLPELRVSPVTLAALVSIEDAARGAATPEQIENPDFRVALFEAAWGKSVGKGTLRILLKNKEGASRDGTRALKSDLRKLAEAGSWERLEKATCLAASLETLKKAQTPVGTDKDTEFATRIEIGEELTELLRPGFKTALAALNEKCPKGRVDGQILDVFKEFFDVFSSDQIWSHQDVKSSLYEYYGLALNISALEKLREKEYFTKHDIIFLKNTLKEVVISDFTENSIEYDQQKATDKSDGLEDISLKNDRDQILFQMSRICARHYIEQEVLNLTHQEKVSLKAALNQSETADEVIEILKSAFGAVLKDTLMSRDQFVKPVEDLLNESGMK